MRSDVHSAALRAAAKVAFSVAFISGCSSPASPTDLADGELGDGAEATEPGTSESEYSTKKKKPSRAAQLAAGCHEDKKDASVPKLTCEQVVNAAFPAEGNYPGAKKTVSAEVQTCCVELLEKSQGSLANHRWDCCANLPADAGQSVSIACTPWGPPVPPSMKRRGRLLAEPSPDAWLALAEVA